MSNIVLFDLDGTLTDPRVGITCSIQYALGHLGVVVEDPDDLTHFIGPPLVDSFREWYGLDEAAVRLAVEKYRERFGTQGLYENEVYPGIPELLQSLADSGKTLAVATSKLEAYAVRILEHFGLSRYFATVAGSLPDGARGDKGEVIAEALRRLQASPSQAVMVGDRKYDVLGAKANGVASIGVGYGYAAPGELEEAGAGQIASTVEELGLLLQ